VNDCWADGLFYVAGALVAVGCWGP
jgi:hypothetical protein